MTQPAASSASSRPRRIAVIGGGIAGVAAAWELRRQLGDHTQIDIIEAYDRLGGKLKTVDFAGGPVDMGAEAFLGLREDFVDLVKDVGLGDELRTPATDKPSGFFVDGRLVDIPRATIMGIPARGADVVEVVGEQAASLIDAESSGQPMTWAPGRDVSVGQLVRARFGQTVVDRMVTPLLGGVYSTAADDLGVRATVPQLAEALDRHGADGNGFYLCDVITELLEERRAKQADATGPKKPMFYGLQRGYRSLIEAMAEQSKAKIRLNSGVESISKAADGWYLEPIGTVDAVVVTAPAPTTSVLLQDIAPAAADVFATIDLASSAVVGMRFASDHGIPQRSGVLLGPDAPTEAKAFTFSSRKWPHLAARGGAFVRASFGTFREPWYVDVDDRALVSYATDDLQRITGESKHPEEFFVQRWFGGLPRYGVGYLDNVNQAMQDISQVAGVAVAGSMINGVGVPATAASGREAARKIARDLS